MSVEGYYYKNGNEITCYIRNVDGSDIIQVYELSSDGSELYLGDKVYTKTG